jgi:hypothetical protein
VQQSVCRGLHGFPVHQRRRDCWFNPALCELNVVGGTPHRNTPNRSPCRWKGPNTASANKQNRSFYNPHCWPFRQHGRCGYRPNSQRNPYQGFTRASGVVTPEPLADAAGHPIRLGTSSGGERLFWWVSFLTSSSNVRTYIEQRLSVVKRKTTKKWASR